MLQSLSLPLEDYGGAEHPRPPHEHLRVLADEGLLSEARRVVPRYAVVVPEEDIFSQVAI